MEYRLKLIRREEICRDTFGLYFDIKNSGLKYIAGQFATVFIPELNSSDNKRYYSIANAPAENDFIEIIIRKSSSEFSNYILNIPIGTELLFEEPRGEIRSDVINDNTVFIAGGTGITPVRSILKDLLNKGISKNLTLFYSNRSPEYAAFIDELSSFSKEKNHIKFIPIFEETEESSKNITYEKGYFSQEIFSKYIKEPANHFYFVTRSAPNAKRSD